VTHRRRRKGWHLAAEIRRVVMGTGCRPGPDVARLWQRSYGKDINQTQIRRCVTTITYHTALILF
jgi:hypothetical protein